MIKSPWRTSYFPGLSGKIESPTKNTNLFLTQNTILLVKQNTLLVKQNAFKAINSNQNHIKSIDFMMVCDDKLIPHLLYITLHKILQIQ